ncbi:hypothetical protein ACVFI8_12255 [Agarivorans sp. MS3-6]|uniref:hypothetical protein n=1 Tax=Agarivorans sp. TSD2052 TaxID=2937286 RepID=UPI00200BE1FF|nr:hypothetical protein [Agarivorans sp. TSD2052]UPW18257.1 hypothetical protein M0C34_18855 [Agarivorans sp. TSD2052]
MRQKRLTKWVLILLSAGQMALASMTMAADLPAPFFPAGLSAPAGLLLPPPPPPPAPGVGSGGSGSGGGGTIFASPS